MPAREFGISPKITPDCRTSLTKWRYEQSADCAGGARMRRHAERAGHPIGDADDDIYGQVTQGERQEIWASGQQSCQTLDRAFESNPPLKSDDVVAVIEGYRAEGWDLESASDITWESVEGRCPEYLDAVKRAVRTYGDPS